MLSLDLKNIETYADSCRRLARETLAAFSDPTQVAEAEAELNAYPGLDGLKEPQGLIFMEDRVNAKTLKGAEESVLDGLVFWEHTAAGEATRLKLGPKFFIHPHTWADEARRAGADLPTELLDSLSRDSRQLRPLSLGVRHILQSIFEIVRLADGHGLDPKKVLARQRILLVVNEQGAEETIRQVGRRRFLGLAAKNVFFMVQSAFPGLDKKMNGLWDFAGNSPRRLHNHGQMAMQKVMEGQVFHLDEQEKRRYLSTSDYFSLLGDQADLVSYNIEDLDYLGQALDFETIGLALALAEEGFGMTMEIVGNNPERPIKGGFCAYDPALGRDVVIESFRLKDMAPADIRYLNKNFNHYPYPQRIFSALKAHGLFMPVTVKEGYLYYQPVQGDMNFLVNTAYISRKMPKPIRSWKTLADSPMAIAAMAAQDAQPGFVRFAESLAC